jgi:hypothetical protein
MDVKTAVSKYGLSKDQYDAVIKNRDSQTRRLEAVDTGQFREGQIKLGSERNENDLTIAGIRAQAATDKLASQQRENDSKAAYREQVIENLQYKSDTDSIKALGALEDNLRTKEAIAKMLSGIPENKPKTRAYLQEKLDKAKSGGKAGSVPINAVGTAGESENKTP